jgi:thioredoxin-like negative regulator of GroEL
VALGAATYFFTVVPGNDDASNLSAYLSEPYPVTVFLSDQKADTWVDAYRRGDYQQAGALLDNLRQESQDNAPMLKYYAGLSHLYQLPPQPTPAIKYLSQVNEGTFAQQAQWYLALAYLLNGQTEEAGALLENIVAAQAYHHEEAAELLTHISQE